MNKKAIFCICICFCIGLGIFAERFEYAIPADSGLCTILVMFPNSDYSTSSQIFDFYQKLVKSSEYYFRYNEWKSMRKYGKCSQFGKSSEIDADSELIAKTIVSHYVELEFSTTLFPKYSDNYGSDILNRDSYKALCDWQKENCPELYSDEFKDKKYKIVIEVEDGKESFLDDLFKLTEWRQEPWGIVYQGVWYDHPERDGFIISYPYLANPTEEQQSRYESYLEEQKLFDEKYECLNQEKAEREKKEQERQEKLSVYEKVSNAKILSVPGKFSVGQKLKFTCNNVSYQTRNNSCLCFFDDYNIESLSFACSNEAIDSILAFEDAKKSIFGSLVFGCSVYGHINSDGKFIIEFVDF